MDQLIIIQEVEWPEEIEWLEEPAGTFEIDDTVVASACCCESSCWSQLM